MCQVNNLVTFSVRATGSEEFLNQIVKALGIIIDRRPKGRPRKIESQTIEKTGFLFSKVGFGQIYYYLFQVYMV